MLQIITKSQMRDWSIRVLLFSFIFLISASAQADNYVACLQQQITKLSYDVGPVDGLLGAKTTNAVTELASKTPELSSLPELNSSTSSIWCKRVGDKFQLTDIWPSSKQPLRLAIGEKITSAQRKLIQEEGDLARQFLNSSLNISIPGTIVITASNNMDELIDLTAKELAGIENKNTVRQQLNAQCRNRIQTGASYGGVVALCFGKSLRTEKAWNNEAREQLRRLVVHEMSHEYQKQLIGNYRTAGGKVRDAKRGPKWLFEGTAIAIELIHVWPNSPLERQISWFKKQQNYSGDGLKRLSPHTTGVDLNFQLNAGYAGVLLASEYGLKSFGEFWKTTPDLGWEKAFEKAFGQSIDEFYNKFGKL